MRPSREHRRPDPRIVAVFGLVAGVILQEALLPGLLPGTAPIEPVFCFVTVLAILGHNSVAIALALAGGLTFDLLTGRLVGLNALSYFISAWAVVSVQKNLVKETLVAPAAVIFASYLIKEIAYLFVLVSLGMSFPPASVLAQFVFSSAVNACFGACLYWLLHFRMGLGVRVDRDY